MARELPVAGAPAKNLQSDGPLNGVPDEQMKTGTAPPASEGPRTETIQPKTGMTPVHGTGPVTENNQSYMIYKPASYRTLKGNIRNDN